MPSVLCIAGLDPSGYSGLSADMRALSFLGIRCMPVASTLTVQNLDTFSEFQPVPIEIISRQLKAIFDEREPDAIKIGMLGSPEIASLVADIIDGSGIPSVIDPVFASSTGFSFIDDELLDIYMDELVPVASIVTPNAHEASILAGMKVDNPESAEQACRIIMNMGARSVLIKGGHFAQSIGTDIFHDSNGTHILKGSGMKFSARGTGCAYSSLIAGFLAQDIGILDAVKRAKLEMAKVMVPWVGEPENP
jgi:hydroxymethylpyrimidine/phosphomethylpyrimidine kinase